MEELYTRRSSLGPSDGSDLPRGRARAGAAVALAGAQTAVRELSADVARRKRKRSQLHAAAVLAKVRY